MCDVRVEVRMLRHCASKVVILMPFALRFVTLDSVAPIYVPLITQKPWLALWLGRTQDRERPVDSVLGMLARIVSLGLEQTSSRENLQSSLAVMILREANAPRVVRVCAPSCPLKSLKRVSC